MNGTINTTLNINAIIQDNQEIKGKLNSKVVKCTIYDQDNKLKGTIQSGLSVLGSISGNDSLVATIVPSTISFPNYDGEYIVFPKVEEQILDTKNKITRENIEVKEIPYLETSNEYGYTITIA